MAGRHAIRAILFDLDGTLRYNRPSSTQVFFDHAASLGILDGADKRLRATRWTHYYWAQSAELVQDIQDFPEEDLFWTNYARRNLIAFDCPPDCAEQFASELHRYMKEEHLPEDWVPPDVPPTLEWLRISGYQLGVLSNRTQSCQEQLQSLGLYDYFSLALVAGEVDAWKPDPKIFNHAVERMGVSASQTLYVGDNYYADILGSQGAGLKPVLIDPDGLFPEANCPVIRSLGELQALIRHL